MFRTSRRNGRVASPPPVTKADRDKVLAVVRDHSDVLALAAPNHPGFTEASTDADAGIRMSTMAVSTCPVNMMKASAVMPCASRDFLEYLELEHRARWDDHYVGGSVVEKVDEQTELKYMSFKAPIPLLRNRDFEIAVCERWDDASQTAVLKAVSTPVGMVHPPDETGRTVRGSILLSGFIVKPITDRESLPVAIRSAKEACEVTYIALVHPRGRLPPAFVNLVIGKQTSTLRVLQRFIQDHPRIYEKTGRRHAGGKTAPPVKSKL
uniref:START domain-containing protein n=1 Tax=Neobodo designis TaxID=312471 RepID=A0A7S1KWP0_NEODS|mmetsp:Transcript_10378/g.32152  ORF Transcript_10378/g.32152 Transcript_10378/m.32152 type:complete len:266 (+) Transcript_10378:133-930(+)|eukprot:CAMPEP_0174827312 /NCGR_PEP_ID=MMETSP1114-20130205/635_1 /TAXON_ID=312471 /ORGANISM="Neobodo designis, Strain CCAP 1951/1" /LENGTH=265 /DNA_ID=CAMNT_0016060947 /DNA_START=132 /DNA_END=929 /DNA_ORIENTATION=+